MHVGRTGCCGSGEQGGSGEQRDRRHHRFAPDEVALCARWSTRASSDLDAAGREQRIPLLEHSDDDDKAEAMELVSSAPDSRNWRGIGIALLVIAGVCALIVTAVILLTPDKGPRVKQARISLEEVLHGTFNPRKFNGSWVSDTDFVYRDADGALVLYNAQSKEKRTLLHNTTFRQYDVRKYSMSPDLNFLLLVHDVVPVFRYSFTAKYKIYDFSNREVFPLKHSSNQEELQYAAWGQTGNQLTYVFENDLYLIPSVGDSSPVRLTDTGSPGVVFNGVADWLYEEEVLGSSSALWWSPGGSRLCYATFNDTGVSAMMLPLYEGQYPALLPLRYPKAGSTNPEVELHVVAVTHGGAEPAKPVQPPQELLDKTSEYYVTMVAFLDEKALLVNFLSRAQNWTLVSVCREAASAWHCSKQAVETASGGWIELSEPPLVTPPLPGGPAFFLRLPVQDAHHGNFRHLAAFQDKRRMWLTHGPYDTIAALAFRPKTQHLFYRSTREGRPGESHVYQVPFDKEGTQSVCLTCDLGDQCLYNNAWFSHDAEFYVLECLGPGVPWVALYSTADNKQLEMLESNAELRELVENRAMPQVRNLVAPLPDGYNASVRLLLPPGLRDEEVLKYPFLVHVYGGPGSQQVTELFRINWGHYLASRKGVVYGLVDGRGSGLQGDRRLHQVYRRLGTVEVEDQLRVARHLKNELSFISGEHTAIWGWSYGGYVSAMALANGGPGNNGNDTPHESGSAVFQCAISVAPVSNWLYYDSAYTERYMGLPRDNLAGYERADLTRAAARLKGKKFLLVHGTADDNVHFQHSMMLAKELTKKGVLYRTQVYPDEKHGLSHVTTHLYNAMEEFIDDCFEGSDHAVEEVGLMQVKAS
ncbi:inactive dipeptidyl peptidase 10-like isoform X2 [Dermacentor andersoni]|uniref:inactive dipeptidyl peptidase 10-like isoform X2 n=1 Tax=Dermacentor andersoni TaxID=34620 RepID=UPI002155F26B|nr:prolyl endopeptidase FAP-like isoform X2 [Dermacentor andersoni]